MGNHRKNLGFLQLQNLRTRALRNFQEEGDNARQKARKESMAQAQARRDSAFRKDCAATGAGKNNLPPPEQLDPDAGMKTSSIYGASIYDVRT